MRPSSCSPCRELGEVPDYFQVDSFKVMVERRFNALGPGHGLRSGGEGGCRWRDAHVGCGRQRPGQRARHGIAQGSRKVPGRDRRAGADRLQGAHPERWYRRVTRVLIESHDARTQRRWFTIGVSSNIVDASFPGAGRFHHIRASQGSGELRFGARKARAMSEPVTRTEAENELRRGLLFGLAAYGMWGFFPAYYKLTDTVSADLVVAHRIAWSVLFVGGFLVSPGPLAGSARCLRRPGSLEKTRDVRIVHFGQLAGLRLGDCERAGAGRIARLFHQSARQHSGWADRSCANA
jgi:hypothetical protein